jgi:hypothetical protein
LITRGSKAARPAAGAFVQQMTKRQRFNDDHRSAVRTPELRETYVEYLLG